MVGVVREGRRWVGIVMCRRLGHVVGGSSAGRICMTAYFRAWGGSPVGLVLRMVSESEVGLRFCGRAYFFIFGRAYGLGVLGGESGGVVADVLALCLSDWRIFNFSYLRIGYTRGAYLRAFGGVFAESAVL